MGKCVSPGLIVIIQTAITNFIIPFCVHSSSDDVVEAILAMEDEVQSCEVMSMNVL